MDSRVLGFRERLEGCLRKALKSAESGMPQCIIVRKEHGAPGEPLWSTVRSCLGGTQIPLWSAAAADRTAPIFEQLLPQNLKNLVRMERPPKIDMALVANHAGINIGTVGRDETALDPDIVSGMMDAVRNFVKDSLAMHTGDKIKGGEVERFEMHGFNILVCPGEHVTTTLVLTGAIDASLKEELKRVTMRIGEQYGTRLAGWKGDMDELEGITAPLLTSFFHSKRYEGEWDFEQMRLMRAKMFDDVLEVVRSVSRETALVIVLDDVDLADTSSLQLASYVARNLKERKVVLILTLSTRSEEAGKNEALSALIEIVLGYEGTVELAQPSDLNVIEIVNALNPEIRTEARTVLIHGALLGSLDERLLALSTGLGYESVAGALSALKDYGLVDKANRSTLASLLQQISDAERIMVTRMAANALETLAPVEVLLLAEHYIWLSSRVPGYAEKAAQWARAAAERQMSSFNISDAIGMWLYAYINEREPKARSEALWRAMEMEWVTARLDDLYKHAEEMIELSSTIGEKRYTGRGYWMMARVGDRRSDHGAALKQIAQAEDAFSFLGDREGLASVLNTKGTILMKTGELHEALRIFEQVRMIAEEVDNNALKARAIANMGSIFTSKGELANAEDLLRSAHKICEDAGIVFDRSMILRNLALLAYRKKEYPECIEWCSESLRLAREIGDWRAAVLSLTVQSAAHDKLGEFENSERCTLEAYALSERTGAGDILALTYNMFETYYKKQLIWLKKTVEMSKSKNIEVDTLKELRKELLAPFSEELELLSELIDGSADAEQRLKIADQLERLRRKLNV
ncbi:MAG: tetratricopeptide repeat protein [Candidatus Thermoplasmatota archaeon]